MKSTLYEEAIRNANNFNKFNQNFEDLTKLIDEKVLKDSNRGCYKTKFTLPFKANENISSNKYMLNQLVQHYRSQCFWVVTEYDDSDLDLYLILEWEEQR